MLTSRRTTIDCLLFDLGGVVMDIDFNRMFEAWAPYSHLSPHQMHMRFRVEDNYKRHERGEISATEYFSYLREHLELNADDKAIANGWNAMLIGENRETVKLLNAIDKKFPCYLLTNSNKTHESHWKKMCTNALKVFSDTFVSSTMGYRKPEPMAFDYVAKYSGHPMERTLFFDDTLANIESAHELGLNAVHVRSSSDIHRALREIRAL